MSNKPMKAARSRHTPGSHPKDCPICNPRKKSVAWRERKAPVEMCGLNHRRSRIVEAKGES